MAGQYAFSDPDAPAAFNPTDEIAQADAQDAQIRASFDENRQRRNYIQAIAAGGSTKRGAIRASIGSNS